MKKLIVLLFALSLCAWAQADCGKCGDKAAAAGEKKCCGECGGEHTHAVAADGEKKCCGECGGKDAVASTCEDCDKCCGECAVSKAMAALPKMTYSVGTTSLCCEHSAKAMAESEKTHMHFVVAKKEFDSKDKAMVALADVTEKFVKEFASAHKCSVSGKTTVCGTSMECGESAAKMAKIAQEAMSKVAMTYKVGDETCNCPNEAASLAKKSGDKTEYLIAGKATCCSVDARIKLAHAKYRAAVMAVAKMQQKSAPAESASTETAAASQS